MLGERGARLGANASDDVEDARGESRLVDLSRELQAREGGVLRGLENDAAASGESWCYFPDGLQTTQTQREERRGEHKGKG